MLGQSGVKLCLGGVEVGHGRTIWDPQLQMTMAV